MFSIKYIYQAVDKFSATANEIGKSVDRLKEKVKVMGDKFEKVGEKMKKVGKNVSLYVSAPITGIGVASVMAASSVETMTVAFESMLKSGDKAKKMVNDLLVFAAKTPFEFQGIGASAKQLMSFGIPAENIIEKLQFLGDIAAGANVPLTDMAAIFGKAKAKGKAMTEELLQLSDRGVPIIAELAKQLKKPESQIFKLASQGKISFAKFEAALKGMATGQGIFADQMIKQSRTIAGLWSTMKDSVFLLSAAFGEAIVDAYGLRDGVQTLSDKIGALTEWFRNLSPGVKNMIVYAASFLAILGPLIVTLGILTASIKTLGWVLAVATSPITWWIVGIAAIAAGLVYAYKKFDWFKKLIDNWVKVLVALFKLWWAAWSAIFDWIADKFNIITNYAKKFGDTIASVYRKIKGFFGLGSDNNSMDINVNYNKSVVSDDVNLSSRSSVFLNVNDPGNNIGEIRTKSMGPTELNVGRNMGLAF